MANEITIPCLPCGSIDEILKFYVALGFEITYQQTRPNTYGCVKHDDIELHFFAMKGVDPANSYSTCIVLIQDADALYTAFAARLRQHFAKLPITGIPRITKPNNKNSSGDYRFNVIDPGGNWIRFIQKTPKSNETTITDSTLPATKLSRAILAADLLVNAKGDFPAAAKILDAALVDNEQEGRTVEQVQALVLRAEVAANMADYPLARTLISDIHNLSLTDDERSSLVGEWQKVEELTETLA